MKERASCSKVLKSNSKYLEFVGTYFSQENLISLCLGNGLKKK